jgi:hypothetical protein
MGRRAIRKYDHDRCETSLASGGNQTPTTQTFVIRMRCQNHGSLALQNVVYISLWQRLERSENFGD